MWSSNLTGLLISEDGYEPSLKEISRMKNRPHIVNDKADKHGKTGEVIYCNVKVQQDLVFDFYYEEEKNVYEEIHDDEQNREGHTGSIYSNIWTDQRCVN